MSPESFELYKRRVCMRRRASIVNNKDGAGGVSKRYTLEGVICGQVRG